MPNEGMDVVGRCRISASAAHLLLLSAEHSEGKVVMVVFAVVLLLSFELVMTAAPERVGDMREVRQ